MRWQYIISNEELKKKTQQFLGASSSWNIDYHRLAKPFDIGKKLLLESFIWKLSTMCDDTHRMIDRIQLKKLTNR